MFQHLDQKVYLPLRSSHQHAMTLFFRLPRPGDEYGMLWFSFIISLKQHLSPLGYCAPTLCQLQIGLMLSFFVVFLTQNSRQSIGNHQNPDNSILAEQLLRERDRAEELANRFAKIKEDLTEAGQREADLRSHLGKKEKEVALVKHELKEAQRKAEQEAESKKKAESERAEIRRKLEDETNRRTKEQNNHIQVFLQSALK